MSKPFLTAITREIGEPLEGCELTHIRREPINQQRARSQHLAYREKLMQLGVDLIHLPALSGLPDAVFIEDAAVVLDEIAVLARPGIESRRAETASVLPVLAEFRPVQEILEPATLDGGDVLRIERRLYVGQSRRTNSEGIAQLRRIAGPFGYEVIPVEVHGCLHLKTGCTWLGEKTITANDEWIDLSRFEDFDRIIVPPDEPWAANTLRIGDKVLLAAGNHKSRLLIEARGFLVDELEIDELQKAEAGLTCLSLIGTQASLPA